MKNIAVATTSRSDYGILHPLLKEINNDKELNLHLLISGTHLSEEYGKTISEIINDGFKDYEIFDVLVRANSGKSASLNNGKYHNEFSNYFLKINRIFSFYWGIDLKRLVLLYLLC